MSLSYTFKIRVRPTVIKRAKRVMGRLGLSRSQFGRQALLVAIERAEKDHGVNGKAGQ